MRKALVSFDDALLRRIDSAARSRGMTRSAYLAGLAERDAARIEGPGASPIARAALEQVDGLLAQTPPEDSTDAIRAERRLR
jgi:hypothetical protein